MEKLESNYNILDWWKKVVIKNYANFNGRARRSEYWYYALMNVIILLPLYLLGIVGAASGSEALSFLGLGGYAILALGTFIPGLAVGIRRLHDIGKSGWYYLIAFIPLVGAIILLVWFFTEGNRFENEFGEDPKNPQSLELEFTGN
jgi:uncharacterized membrane protein YhaH (DUF805 family)